MAGSKAKQQCECYDKGCKAGHAWGRCENKARLITLWRVDMDDLSGTRVCPDCAQDMYSSGLFRGRQR